MTADVLATVSAVWLASGAFAGMLAVGAVRSSRRAEAARPLSCALEDLPDADDQVDQAADIEPVELTAEDAAPLRSRLLVSEPESERCTDEVRVTEDFLARLADLHVQSANPDGIPPRVVRGGLTGGWDDLDPFTDYTSVHRHTYALQSRCCRCGRFQAVVGGLLCTTCAGTS